MTPSFYFEGLSSSCAGHRVYTHGPRGVEHVRKPVEGRLEAAAALHELLTGLRPMRTLFGIPICFRATGSRRAHSAAGAIIAAARAG